MTPEMRIAQLENELKQLKATATFPFEVEKAIKDRLGGVALVLSGKTAASENVLVNEAGVATHDVMRTPDNFLEIVVNGTTYYIPAFTS